MRPRLDETRGLAAHGGPIPRGVRTQGEDEASSAAVPLRLDQGVHLAAQGGRGAGIGAGRPCAPEEHGKTPDLQARHGVVEAQAGLHLAFELAHELIAPAAPPRGERPSRPQRLGRHPFPGARLLARGQGGDGAHLAVEGIDRCGLAQSGGRAHEPRRGLAIGPRVHGGKERRQAGPQRRVREQSLQEGDPRKLGPAGEEQRVHHVGEDGGGPRAVLPQRAGGGRGILAGGRAQERPVGLADGEPGPAIDPSRDRQEAGVSVQDDDVAFLETDRAAGAPHHVGQLEKPAFFLGQQPDVVVRPQRDRGPPELPGQEADVGEERAGKRQRAFRGHDARQIVGARPLGDEHGARGGGGVQILPVPQQRPAGAAGRGPRPVHHEEEGGLALGGSHEPPIIRSG